MHMENQPKGFFDGNPKMIFLFGLVSGIAVMSILGGEISLPSANGGTDDAKAAADTTKTGTNTGTTVKNEQTGTLPEVTSKDHVRGDLEKAKVVIVEYGDFQCPFCARHHPTMTSIKEKYGDDVAWVFRHYPLSFHQNAVPSANASECASEQGKFWEYADAMIEDQDTLNGSGTLKDDYYVGVAKTLGLDTGKFTTCLEDNKYQSVVDADMKGAQSVGVSGTPATFINGQLVTGSSGKSVGAAPASVFESIIDGILKK